MADDYRIHDAIVVARDAYTRLGKPGPPVKVDALLRYAERVMEATYGGEHSIEVYSVEVKKSEYRGLFVRGNGSDNPSKIYYSGELNNCWRRFVVAKEAMHVLVDDNPSRW